MLQAGEVGTGDRGTTTGVEDKVDHRTRACDPQIPAAADLTFERDKDLPARLVIEKQLLGHLFFVQRGEDRLEQRRNRSQATGDGAGRDRQGLVT